ncbi:ATP-binding protein [Haloferula sp. BvORR071]|uniref:ATP-binding protein n=1 Tax=Haloferula sp. BvORR071 TaxID=1396141 RepID=UPI000553AA3E|nr:ATP-binding protein [Haloferula sp. BvORR071]
MLIPWSSGFAQEERPLTLAGFSDSLAKGVVANANFRLAAKVCAVSADRRLLAIQDESSTLLLECPILPPDLAVGSSVIIDANGSRLSRDRFAIQVDSGPLIEVDGHHATITRDAPVYLEEGLQPVRVEWFNGLNLAELKLEYEGPGVPHQQVPASSWVHDDNNGTQAPGLRYEVFTRDWWLGVADFDEVKAVGGGIVKDLDISVRPQPSQVGLAFSGRMRIPKTGIYTFRLSSDDGSRFYIGKPQSRISVEAVAVEVPQPQAWNPSMAPGAGAWVSAEGNVTFAARVGGHLELDVSGPDASFHVTVLDGTRELPQRLLRQHVMLKGIGRAEGIIVVDGRDLELRGDSTGQVELLTRADQIRRLQPEQARKRRARIRGVVVMSSQDVLVLQDASGGVFIRYSAPSGNVQPRPGEFWEVEGPTDPGDFSPMIYAERARYLGSAAMPEAARPSWEQIASGGMDAEWVELEGVVVSASLRQMVLLTRDGKVQINDNLSYPLPTHRMTAEEMSALPGSVVRIRGVFTANWDSYGRVNAGICQMGNATMSVDEPAPVDPYAAEPMQASDLLLFISHPVVFKRVRVTGVVLHARPPEYFLWDGARGFRIFGRDAVPLHAGDQVEAAGFPRIGGPSPMLMEADVRKTGTAAVPAANKIEGKAFPNPRLDSTRVMVEASLLSDTLRQDERILEMQAGPQRFVARLAAAAVAGGETKPIERGSLLRLTGTYASAVSSRPGVAAAEPFELLLDSAADLVVLQRGPWWTLRHTIAAIAILSGGLLLALVWVSLLRRTVAQRGKQLAAEIEEREAAERYREIEKERTRVAHDLHDELGAGLTEAGILTSLVKNPGVPAEKKDGYLDQLAEVCRALVTGLDEIVWAVNPRYDSVTDLAGYFSLFAQRFLGIAGITCRLQIAESVAEHPIGSHQRHDIFLAFKEALNNIVRHSQAREVRLAIGVADRILTVSLADDGCGLDPAETKPGSDGLVGMQERMEKLGGHCRISSNPGGGTTVEFSLPLERINP